MTAKQAKEYLNQVRKIDKRLVITLRKVEKLRSSLEYHSPSLEGSSGGGNADRMPDTVSKIIEYEKKAEELKAIYIAKYIEIEKVIASVEDTVLREVLERRYLLYQKWEQIAEEMHYSTQNVYRLHGEALKKIRVK